MKKLKYLVALLLCLIVVPSVKAASVSLAGTNTIKINKQTTIYVKVNGISKVRGADISFSTSGSIALVSAKEQSGFAKMSQSGNRYALYSQNGVGSGTSVFAITVKGTSVGTGRINVNVEASDGDNTYAGLASSIDIKVNPAMTEAEKKAQEEARKQAEEKAKKEAEERAKKEAEAEAAKQEAIKKARVLVEASEKSLQDDDYEAALKAVESLPSCDEKTDFTKRLEDVKFKIAVKKECKTEDQPKEIVKENNSNAWMILSLVLLVCLVGESIYLVCKVRKNNEN